MSVTLPHPLQITVNGDICYLSLSIYAKMRSRLALRMRKMRRRKQGDTPVLLTRCGAKLVVKECGDLAWCYRTCLVWLPLSLGTDDRDSILECRPAGAACWGESQHCAQRSHTTDPGHSLCVCVCAHARSSFCQPDSKGGGLAAYLSKHRCLSAH